MKIEFPFILVLCGIGIVTRKLSWKGWFAVAMLVGAWMMFNWVRG